MKVAAQTLLFVAFAVFIASFAADSCDENTFEFRQNILPSIISLSSLCTVLLLVWAITAGKNAKAWLSGALFANLLVLIVLRVVNHALIRC